MVLYFFKTRGGLKGRKDQLRTFQFPNKDAEPEKFRAAMELVESVITEEQWETLVTHHADDQVWLDTVQHVTNQCMKKIHELEVEAGLTQPMMDASKSRAKDYFIGLGSRVIKYKKKVNKVSLIPVQNTFISRFVSQIRNSPIINRMRNKHDD